jgi:hypothetical protein
MFIKMELNKKLLLSLVSSLEFTYKVTTAALLFAMIKQYACIVYVCSLIIRIALIHVSLGGDFGKNAIIALLYTFLESLVFFGEHDDWKLSLAVIWSNVMSLVEALVALLLLYYLPSPAADQLGDWGVKYILVIIIAVSYVLSKPYVFYLVYKSLSQR